MSDISFNEPRLSSQDQFGRPRVSRMVRLVMKMSGGSITTDGQANYVLVFVAIIALMTTFFIIGTNAFGTLRETGGKGPSQEELEAYRKVQPF